MGHIISEGLTLFPLITGKLFRMQVFARQFSGYYHLTVADDWLMCFRFAFHNSFERIAERQH
jgi:hypothetical protein